MKKSFGEILAMLLSIALMLSALAGCGGDTNAPAESGIDIAGTSWRLMTSGAVYFFGTDGELEIFEETDGAQYTGTYTWDVASARGSIEIEGSATDISYDADSENLMIVGEDGNSYALTPYEDPADNPGFIPSDDQPDASGKGVIDIAGTAWYLTSDSVVYSFYTNGELELYAEADGSQYFGSYTWEPATASGSIEIEGFASDLSYDPGSGELLLIGEDGNAYGLELYEAQQQEPGSPLSDDQNMDVQGDMLSGTCWDNDEAEMSLVFDNGIYVACTTESSDGGTYLFDGELLELFPDVGGSVTGSIREENLLVMDGFDGYFVTVAEATYAP